MIRGVVQRVRRKLGGVDRARYQRGPSERIDGYPPPFPRGWYRIARAVDIPAGETLRVDALGVSLLAFRGVQDGALHVLDAHCPHQGADLGVGGKVVGNCVRCPFHDFDFDGCGKLVKVPTLSDTPKIKTRAWPVREVHGMVWIWHDSAKGEPDYEPEYQSAITSGDMVLRGEHDAGVVRMHIIEFAENSVDFQHFKPLHGQMLVPWTQIEIPGVEVNHSPTWKPDADRGYIAYFIDQAVLRIGGRVVPRTSALATITFFGPGGVVWFRIQVPDVGDILIYQTHLPLEPLALDVQFRWFADEHIPRALVSYIVGSWVSQWQADIAVWENKIYKRRPMLTKSDGPVHEMRRWYQQFYDADTNTPQRDVKVAS